MNFNTLLNTFEPLESGDFFSLYNVNGRSFVIYCDESNGISCIELYSFSNINPPMLAELLNLACKDENVKDEFSFPVKCSRKQIISYLFDISSKETNVKLKHVSGLHGYLMKSINQDKVNKDSFRNLFQFNPGNGYMKLLFDDRQCFTSIRTDKAGTVYFCWNPILFFGLDKSGDPDSSCYLLASSSDLLSEYVISKVPSERKIQILTGGNFLESLLFVTNIVRLRDLSYKLFINSDTFTLTVEFRSWPTPQKVLNFISSVNRGLPDGYAKLSCFTVNGKTYLFLPAIPSYMKPFLSSYSELIQSEILNVSI